MKIQELARNPQINLSHDRRYWQMTYQLNDDYSLELRISHDWTDNDDEYTYYAWSHGESLTLFPRSEWGRHLVELEKYGQECPDDHREMSEIAGAKAAFEAMKARWAAVQHLLTFGVNF